MSVARPIDPAAVRAHPAPIRVPVTRAGDLNAEMLDVRTLAEGDLMPVLLAGATVPVIADLATNGGEDVFDGAFVAPLPVRQALDDGCTDLVVILSLPRWVGPPRYEEWILIALARRRKVPEAVARSVRIGREARKAALATLRRPPAGVNVTVLAPEVVLGRSLEQRPAWVRRLVDAGADAGRLAVALARTRSVA
jgi:predicted patatin/cPLA2 family phospholipase